jgi:hypothetical protein
MHTTIVTGLIMLGMLLMAASQLAIALHAFTGNPIKGLLCFTVPFYALVYARRHAVGIWLMRAWYAGVSMLIGGGVLAS